MVFEQVEVFLKIEQSSRKFKLYYVDYFLSAQENIEIPRIRFYVLIVSLLPPLYVLSYPQSIDSGRRRPVKKLGGW